MNLFGTIAMRSDLISQEQLRRALEIQKSGSVAGDKRLGQILIFLGALKQRDVRHILDVQQLLRVPDESVRFGVAAIQNGYATDEQVQRCLQIQKDTKGGNPLLGEVMVREGIISDAQRQLLLKGIARLRGNEGGPRSRLVQAIRRLDEGGAPSRIHADARGVRIDEVKRLIREGVKSLTHVAILTHIAIHPKDNYTAKELAKALGEEQGAIEDALADLTILGIVKPQEGWLGRRYEYTEDPRIQHRVQLLLATFRDRNSRADIAQILLRRQVPDTR